MLLDITVDFFSIVGKVTVTEALPVVEDGLDVPNLVGPLIVFGSSESKAPNAFELGMSVVKSNDLPIGRAIVDESFVFRLFLNFSADSVEVLAGDGFDRDFGELLASARRCLRP